MLIIYSTEKLFVRELGRNDRGARKFARESARAMFARAHGRLTLKRESVVMGRVHVPAASFAPTRTTICNTRGSPPARRPLTGTRHDDTPRIRVRAVQYYINRFWARIYTTITVYRSNGSYHSNKSARARARPSRPTVRLPFTFRPRALKSPASAVPFANRVGKRDTTLL